MFERILDIGAPGGEIHDYIAQDSMRQALADPSQDTCIVITTSGFPECDWGQIHVNARGDPVVFLVQRLAAALRWYAPRWRTGGYKSRNKDENKRR
jgi:hypothetical protein